MRVWTKQHENVLKMLLEDGRYTAKKEFAAGDLEDQAYLMREAYDWLTKNGPMAKERPEDAEYPVWVSFAEKTTMLKDPDTVILELEVDPALLTFISIEKWSAILDYSYIAARLGRNEDVRVEVLTRICLELGCSMDEILEVLPEKTVKG